MVTKNLKTRAKVVKTASLLVAWRTILALVNRVPSFNLFVPNAPILHPWKHQKTLRLSDIFRGVEKGCIVSEWVSFTSSNKIFTNVCCGFDF